MRVLVCGGRDFGAETETYDEAAEEKQRQWKFAFSVLVTELGRVPGQHTIISGGADGADACGEDYAFMTGQAIDLYPAQWWKYGPSAGPRRNKQMLEKGKPDLVIAFPGGKGTANMVKLAREAGVEVKEIKYNGNS